MTEELYKRYRPKAFKQMIGQAAVVETLQGFLSKGEVPHTILFTGPSGCGKTTLARILVDKLGCKGQDFRELNCADFRGIDMVREVGSRIHLAPFQGKCRIWLIDECHRLTGEAQDAFLKLLEDTPSHVFFLLATTNPQKLTQTIRTRSTLLQLKPLKQADMERLLRIVCKREDVELSEEVGDKIVEVADGSPRMALVILNKVIGQEDEEKQLDAVREADAESQAIDLCRALFKRDGTWKNTVGVLKGTEGLDAEAVRFAVLGYASKVLLNGGSELAYRVIDAFRENFWNSKRAGLIAACWEVFNPVSD